jgi:archaellum component FlaG (FlaF/FlaG flagellin family)
MEHRVNGKWQSIKGALLPLALDLAQYFANVENRKIHYPVNVGDVCVVLNSEDSTYNRCVVLKIIKQQ